MTAAASSYDGSVSESVSIQGSAAQPISPDSPYWMPVKISATDPSIPRKDGYFEVQAPEAYLNMRESRATLRWVDFYG